MPVRTLSLRPNKVGLPPRPCTSARQTSKTKIAGTCSLLLRSYSFHKSDLGVQVVLLLPVSGGRSSEGLEKLMDRVLLLGKVLSAAVLGKIAQVERHPALDVFALG